MTDRMSIQSQHRIRSGSRRGGVLKLAVISAAGLSVGIGVLIWAWPAAPAYAQDGRGQSISSGRGSAGQTSDLAEATLADFEITTTATGELRARNQIEIRSTLDSETTIIEIIPEGTFVHQGEVLIKLNSEPIQTRIEEETLQLESARAAVVEAEQSFEIQVSENESNTRAAELKLALAKLDLEQWQQGEVESKRQELDHSEERAAKDEERLHDKFSKSKTLQEKGYYSLDQLKQDELNWEQGVAQLSKAKLDKQVYWSFQHPKDKRKKESDVEEATAELERVARQNASKIASKEADRSNKRQALTVREAKFKKYQEQLAAATIKAPSDGLVVYSTSMDGGMRWGGDSGPLQIGSKVSPNEYLIALPDTTEMVAAVKVHESLAGRLKPGMRASVKVDAAGDKRFTGKIESVGILAEQTSRWMDPNLREYTVRVLLDLPTDRAVAADPPALGADAKAGVDKPVVAKPADAASAVGPTVMDAKTADGLSGGNKAKEPVAEVRTLAKAGPAGVTHGLKPSMRCESEIMLGGVKNVIAVPIQSIFSDGLVRYVHVQDSPGSKFTRRPLLVGQRSERFAEVRAGLQAGERVLIRKPEPSEVLSKPWDPKQLAAVGLKLNDQGVVVPGEEGGKGPGKRPMAGEVPVGDAKGKGAGTAAKG